MDSRQSTILVVDDEPAIRLRIAAKLAQQGHTVLQASGVQDGRVHLQQPIDLALLDYHLSDGCGFDLLDELRSHHAGIPAIMLTGHATVAHAVSAMKHGAFHYVGKPMDLDELSALVETALASTSTRKTAAKDYTFKLPADGIDIRELEKSLVEQALTRTSGNRTKAAKLLGMNRDQIRYRIDQFGLEGHKRRPCNSQPSHPKH